MFYVTDPSIEIDCFIWTLILFLDWEIVEWPESSEATLRSTREDGKPFPIGAELLSVGISQINLPSRGGHTLFESELRQDCLVPSLFRSRVDYIFATLTQRARGKGGLIHPTHGLHNVVSFVSIHWLHGRQCNVKLECLLRLHVILNCWTVNIIRERYLCYFCFIVMFTGNVIAANYMI